MFSYYPFWGACCLCLLIIGWRDLCMDAVMFSISNGWFWYVVFLFWAYGKHEGVKEANLLGKSWGKDFLKRTRCFYVFFSLPSFLLSVYQSHCVPTVRVGLTELAFKVLLFAPADPQWVRFKDYFLRIWEDFQIQKMYKFGKFCTTWLKKFWKAERNCC